MSKRNDLPEAPSARPAIVDEQRRRIAETFGGVHAHSVPRGRAGGDESMSEDDARDLARALKTLPDDLHALRQDREALRAEVRTVQQKVAQIEVNGVGGGDFGGIESVGAQACRILADNPEFQAEADTAQRGGRGSRFSARARLENGIRAAITNVDVGQVGDTSIVGDRDRRPGVVMPVERRLSLLDVLPSRRVNADEVEFIQLTATGDAGVQAKEGDTKAEVDVAGELVTAKIATVAAFTKASRQILSDSTALQAAIDRILRYKVRGKLENLLINGNGTTDKIDGLLNQAPVLVPTIAAATNPADIVGEALMSLDTAGYRPNVVLMHPRDWFRLQITKQTVETESYVFGSPTNPLPPALWNTQVVVTPAMPEDTGLVLDTSFVTLLDRWQMNVMVATENQDDFIKNLVTILAELRAGLEVADQMSMLQFDFGNVP